ncbi:4'-phosphopantetheinyl transferase family protein [Streptomyces ipomoeae]|uniref:4'-phosphopantetheinyl transferase family protein n=1 Tax=Streptomyces ipomoeae TaxID=103232 RepID=UPI001146957C|nr:4'-phosphopantetheinyl transferase superfamily protein [Streptomyces ipomoeae]MDX2939106.1 4'-phosphopantetheinyl transferase superfamily protein [Streptomyces ipomoeae]TQE30896.1 4'-phosphopantetheinyl transferase superfamily protein [Streptomyces ipomoeae]
MIEEIVPSEAAAADTVDDPDGADPERAFAELHPQEAAAVAGALPRRRLEYAAVRRCARRAMSAIGVAPAPLLSDWRGAPRWPGGVVGSMTHCAGYGAAAVASASALTGLGIDAEPNEPLPDGLLERISLPAERPSIDELGYLVPEVRWDRLLFSAKEAVFKTWYPLTHRELGFDQAEIRFDPGSGTFSARLLLQGPRLRDGTRLERLDGRWLCRAGLLLTATAVGGPPVGMSGGPPLGEAGQAEVVVS